MRMGQGYIFMRTFIIFIFIIKFVFIVFLICTHIFIFIIISTFFLFSFFILFSYLFHQVDQIFTVTWVQPRVLDKEQLAQLSFQLEGWTEK